MEASQYDFRAQAMEEVHFDWRCIVCCMVALSPLHLEQQHLPGTESVYFDLDNSLPLGLNVTSAIPSFIYSVGPGNHFMLLDPDVFFALFFVTGNFRSDFSCHPFLFHLICLFFFKDGLKAFMSQWQEKEEKEIKRNR